MGAEKRKCESMDNSCGEHDETMTKRRFGLPSAVNVKQRKQITLFNWVERTYNDSRAQSTIPRPSASHAPVQCLGQVQHNSFHGGSFSVPSKYLDNISLGVEIDTQDIGIDASFSDSDGELMGNGDVIVEGGQYVRTTDITASEVEVLASGLEALTLAPEPDRDHDWLNSMKTCLAASLGHDWTEVRVFLGAHTPTCDDSAFRLQFDVFRDQEATLSGWDPAHIVRPSGSPNNSLHLMLNYPTFRSQKLQYGESADDTNVCTKLLLDKGLSTDNSFWFEACFRRRKAFSGRQHDIGTQAWPLDVQQLHASFTSLCQSFPKKVFLVFGAPNRCGFLSTHNVVEKSVRVSETETVQIGFIRTTNGDLSQIVVFCPHPEWLFWNWTPWASRYFDACVNVAAALADVAVIPNFFENRARRVKSVFSQKIALQDADTTRKLEKLNGVLCKLDRLPNTITPYLSEMGISSKDLEMEARCGRSVAEYVFQFVKNSLPPKSSWNKGVRMPRNLPRNLPAQTQDLALPHSRPITSPPSIRIVPNKTRSKNPIVQTAAVHLGREILLMCIRCGVAPSSKPVDKKPVFCTISTAKGRYIAQRQACKTPSCNPPTRKGQVDQFMVPQDPDVPYIRSDNLSKVEIPKSGFC